MKYQWRVYPKIFILLLICLYVARLAQAQSVTPADLETVVDTIAKKSIEKQSAVGLSIGMALGDQIVLAKGYGTADLELEVPATEQMVYRIGSITKQFTAAAILLLAEEGKLKLDDPLTMYLPDYPTQSKVVTLRQLLQHTSGIINFTSLPTHRRLLAQNVTHADILNRFKDKPFNFEPGTKFQYCNSGYYLLGMVIENISELSYEEFIQKRIFNPLKMNTTYYDKASRIIPHRASGYSRWGDKFRNAGYVNMKQPFAAGAMASTVSDLILWQRGLVNNSLLRPDSYKLMTTPGKLSNGKFTSYGLGAFLRKINNKQTIGHGGGIIGFQSDLIYYPELDCTIVVLANCENTNPARISRQIATYLIKSKTETTK
ncbi:MAG: beta-lactamase family protein [Planctomycetes bacterium]|nr:beta-lactamase family protein [Planctomycetota bacterium]MCH9776783.1 beta-lactamase family protein [Planctomycetota bacterium]MCH9789216.1 beta-lactamase family protein [Planctomycetota bacterium]